ncbi:hypothetical protein [Medusavirus stheno T3]|uniref:HNH endonuclease n=1 Tax=Medusavirus stheno T3 TaxID=3069717 RepID=A0A7S7YEG4_9VIRU|nr:hypothetical protein QKU73_gp113 [Acanthamoeba castellanii medusavirus]QPB44294.1 hypothetical protein [Medusavirus stheno T3]
MRERNARFKKRSISDIDLTGTKTCRLCGISKRRDRFRIEVYYSDGLVGSCTACEKKTRQKSRIKQLANHRQRKKNAKIGQWCVACQEDDPNLLEFDHLNPSTKRRAVADMMGVGDSAFALEVRKTQLLCVTCHRRKSVATYRENAKARSKPEKRSDKYAKRNREHVCARKMSIGECSICHRQPSSADIESGMSTFEFDHIDRATKTTNISVMVNTRTSLDRIDSEIAKCRLLCVSCHRRHTREQLGWFDYGDAPSKGLSPDQLRRLSFARSIVDGLIATYGQPRDADGPVSRPRLCDFILANLDKLKPEGI